MKSLASLAFIATLLGLPGPLAFAADLSVGPNQPFARLEDALAQARPGDVILVYPLPDHQPYPKVALSVKTPLLTIRSAAPAGTRVALSGRGFDYTGLGSVPRAIVEFGPNVGQCVLEGFELFGAHNATHNGAGVRINQANGITLRNCEIHDNDMGVMSNGDGTLQRAVNQLIAACVIHDNGDRSDPGFNHNLYLGGASVTLSGCEIYASLTGHNVKSRAHTTTVSHCLIHDSANRELDLVDAAETAFAGSDAILIGNTITKGLKCPGNGGVIHFGQDGGHPHNGTLRLASNNIFTPFVAPVIQLSAPEARAVLDGNVIKNSGQQQSGQILVAPGSPTAPAPVRGLNNKVSSSFAASAASLPALEHTTILDSPSR